MHEKLPKKSLTTKLFSKKSKGKVQVFKKIGNDDSVRSK